MKYSIYLDQIKMIEWGLNTSQAILFSYLYELPSWARPSQDGEYYFVSQSKLLDELPCLDIGDRAIRKILVLLEEHDLIQRMTIANKRYVRVTEKGKTWGRGGKINNATYPQSRNSSSGKVGTQVPESRNSSSGKVGTEDPVSRNSGSGDHITRSYNHDHITSSEDELENNSVDKFSMNTDWKASYSSFSKLCFFRKINLDRIANIDDLILEFIGYWSTKKDKKFNQEEWEHKLVNNIVKLLNSSSVSAIKISIKGEQYSLPSMNDDNAVIQLCELLKVSTKGVRKPELYQKLTKAFVKYMKEGCT